MGTNGLTVPVKHLRLWDRFVMTDFADWLLKNGPFYAIAQ